MDLAFLLNVMSVKFIQVILYSLGLFIFTLHGILFYGF